MSKRKTFIVEVRLEIEASNVNMAENLTDIMISDLPDAISSVSYEPVSGRAVTIVNAEWTRIHPA